VVPLPRGSRAARILPSRRSVEAGLALVALAAILYGLARETPMFAVRTIDVSGVSGAEARQVRAALAPLQGESLLKLNGTTVSRLATTLPFVAGVGYDRAFPSTLRVRVEPEQPLGVVRHGIEAWLVSGRGRVIARIAQGTHQGLPRIWLPPSDPVSLGAVLAPGGGAEEVAALAPLRDAGLAAQVSNVGVVNGQVVYHLRGGLELRAGAPSDLPLKLAVAKRILAQTPVARYLDVSVVERPVAGIDPRVSG
jgi:cell division protein FtsQ